jgi:hypothetical protein
MHNKILLGVAISIAAMQTAAVPFAPTDARAMAMGGTGVASAKTVHAVQFNPSLLSSAHESDDFGLLLPQIGGYFSDEDEFIDSAEKFVDDDFVSAFDTAITNITTPIDNIQSQISIIDTNSQSNGSLSALTAATGILATNTQSLTTGTGQLTVATKNLNDGLATLSQKALRGGLGFGAGIAIPSKKFSVAISANNSTTFSGELLVAQSDLDILTNYTGATNSYAGVVATYASAANAAAITLQDIETEQAVIQAAIDNNNTPDLTKANALATQLEANNTALTAASTGLNTFTYGGTGRPTSEGTTPIFENGALASGADALTLDSKAHIIAVALTEVAISVSREFDFSGKQVAIGITPKLQRIDVYDYIVSVDSEVDGDAISDFGVNKNGFNLDIGASTRFGKIEQGTAGIVVKNLMSNSLVSINGQKVEIKPQLRAGVLYQAFGWVNLAADLDLIENEPVAFEEPSQFFALGVEADVFGFMQLRGGFRTNIAASGQQVVSGGVGLSPFSLFHMDLGLYANTSDPKKEVGAVFEFGVDW